MPWNDPTSFDPTGASPFSLGDEELPGPMKPEHICLIHQQVLGSWGWALSRDSRRPAWQTIPKLVSRQITLLSSQSANYKLLC